MQKRNINFVRQISPAYDIILKTEFLLLSVNENVLSFELQAPWRFPEHLKNMLNTYWLDAFDGDYGKHFNLAAYFAHLVTLSGFQCRMVRMLSIVTIKLTMWLLNYKSMYWVLFKRLNPTLKSVLNNLENYCSSVKMSLSNSAWNIKSTALYFKLLNVLSSFATQWC